MTTLEMMLKRTTSGKRFNNMLSNNFRKL